VLLWPCADWLAVVSTGYSCEARVSWCCRCGELRAWPSGSAPERYLSAQSELLTSLPSSSPHPLSTQRRPFDSLLNTV
jgi:hypothetical protein